MEPLGFVVLTIEYHREDGQWLARCLELGTSTFGDTFEEAEQAIREAILLHLNTLEDVGERQRFFREHNIKSYTVRPSRPRPLKVLANEDMAYQRVVQPLFGAIGA